MAVREFDGVDDRLTVSAGTTTLNSASTWMALVYPLSISPAADEAYWSATDSGGLVLLALFHQSTNGLDMGSDTVGDSAVAAFGLLANTWNWFGYSKAAGTVIPTFHRSTYGSGTWSHTAGSATEASPVNAINGHTFAAIAPAGGNYRDVRYAVAVHWNRSVPNLEIETICNAATTAALNTASGGAPAALWDFNQAAVGTAVSDLTGHGANQTSINQTTVINAADPAGYVFGITAAGAAIPTFRPYRMLLGV
jgi:hypothetical protein